MLYNLLDQLPPGGQDVTIGTASLYALIGFIVVFLGIAFLIFVVWAVGKFMKNTSIKAAKQANVETAKETAKETAVIPSPVEEEGISEETVAVITAALMAYYQQQNAKCEFTVKRIKRM